MEKVTKKGLLYIIAGIAALGGLLLPSFSHAQVCGNLGITGMTALANNDIGNVRDTNGGMVVGDIYHQIYSYDHNNYDAFPNIVQDSDLCLTGDVYVINTREGSVHPNVYLSNPGAFIVPAGVGNFNLSTFGFPEVASIELPTPFTLTNFYYFLDNYYQDIGANTNQRPVGSWACFNPALNNIQYCTVYNYTGNPTCGIAQGTFTGNSQFAGYSYDAFCDNLGLLNYNSTYTDPENPNGGVLAALKSDLSVAISGDTITWGCSSRLAGAGILSNNLAPEVNTSCSAVFVDPNSNQAPQPTANCGRFTNTSIYPFGFYSNELLDIANDPGSNAYSTNSNFCLVGTQLVGNPSESGSTRNWACFNSSNNTTSSCTASVRQSPDPGCETFLSPYNNTATLWVTDPGQITDNFCISDSAHPTAGPLSLTAVGGGDDQPWSWTCEGQYYNTLTCNGTSYGGCGSDNGGTVFDFNTGSNTLCTNGVVVNVTTGASSDPSFPFTIDWTCRGSTTDGSTDEICSAFAQPAECGMAHMADHENLLSTSNDLCSFGQSTNFGTRSPLDPANQIEYTWTCEGGDDNGLLDVQCEAYKPKDPTDGLCNALTNNLDFTYDNVSSYLQCTQGTPSVPILPNPTNNQWTYSCLGVNGGVDAQCTINEITNAQCTQYNTTVTTVPSVLCDAGIATTPVISNGSWIYDCQGENGGTNVQCSVSCTNGKCDDGTPPCDPTGTGANACGDGVQPTLNVGETCNDFDGCVCGTNIILNGTQCLAFVPNFDGKQADLTIRTHMASSGSVLRGETTSFTIHYQNNGPDPATGTTIEYIYSDLLEDLSSSTLFTVSGNTQSGSSTIVYDRLLFTLGQVDPGESGHVIVSAKVKTLLAGSDITNNAQIYSLVDDPNPLNNPKSVSIKIRDDLAQLNGYLPNPLLVLKSLIDRYDMIMEWVNPDLIYKDVFPGDTEFMHMITVTKADVMNGYKTEFARYFGREKCLSRAEALIVAAKMMHIKGDDDVYENLYELTAFEDTNYNIHITHFINWAYKRGLTDVFDITFKDGKRYLKSNYHVTHSQLKEIFNKLYRITNQNTNVLKPLLTEKDKCVTRGETARTVAHLLRGNPQVIMGYNDEFLKALYQTLKPMSIKDRGEAIRRTIFLLNERSADRWHKLGLDPETLIGILSSALKGEMFNYDYETSSVDSFFFEVSDDQYDQYLQDILNGDY